MFVFSSSFIFLELVGFIIIIFPSFNDIFPKVASVLRFTLVILLYSIASMISTFISKCFLAEFVKSFAVLIILFSPLLKPFIAIILSPFAACFLKMRLSFFCIPYSFIPILFPFFILIVSTALLFRPFNT